jgi:iron complex transport system substrate-binding protein
MPRILSLDPAATYMAHLLGLSDQIVGVTHACRDPAEVVGRPVVVRPKFDADGLRSDEIDRIYADFARRGESPYRMDMDLIARLQPHVVLVQAVCDI